MSNILGSRCYTTADAKPIQKSECYQITRSANLDDKIDILRNIRNDL
jgi:hypothetical protein